MMPLNPELDSDRFSYLFDLAVGLADGSVEDLSSGEQDQFVRIQRLVSVIDESWQIPEEQADRMQRGLLAKLAQAYPDHPWLRGTVVQTLGDLVQVGSEEMPNLPKASLDTLASDDTPVETLRQHVTRAIPLGKAITRANLPDSVIDDFIDWVNQAVRNLVSKPNQAGLVYPRRQHGRRKRE